jgi:amino acid adenylation domain-containing protein
LIHLLPHTILNSAEKLPNKEAFKCGNHSLTFTEVKDRMNQLANLLHELGIKKGDRIGIYLNRSIETVIAMYGIMQAGAVYVPLDPKTPIDRTQFLLDDCNIEILISHNSQRKNLKKIIVNPHPLKTIIGVKGEWDLPTVSWEETTIQSTVFENPFPMMEKDLAYIMYTSGSTGNPKGIMHSHASGLAYARLSADLYQINEQDKIGNHAPIYFDISTLGYFTAPFVGATTVIVTDAHTILPVSLSQLIEKEQLTIWYSVPLALIQILQSGLEEKNWSSLRWVLYGGEPFPPKYLQTLMTSLPNTRFCNVYGPAEVNQCTYYHIPEPPIDNTSIPLGKVWGNTVSLVLDEDGEEIHANGVGELLIRSTTMMTGYWQNPTLTEKGLYKRIAPNGLEEIFYKTGDLVEVDQNAQLHFMGRKDHQIKIRGYRVELDAVEAILVAHEKVVESAVFAIKGDDDIMTINAAVIVQENKEVIIDELTSFLKEKLPSYAVPASIKILDTFPRTGSVKVSRSAIKENWSNDL